MDLAQDMERPGIPALEIDGDDRQAGTLDQLGDVLRPGNVLHDPLAAEGRAVPALLPGGHLPGGEKAERVPVGDVAEGGADAGDAARAAGGEIVHGDETVLEGGDHRKQEGGQDPVVRPAGADDRVQDHPVHAAEVVVGHRDEGALAGNVVQLLLGNDVFDTDFFQHAGGKSGSLYFVVFDVDPVDFLQLQQPIGEPGDQLARQSLEPQCLLQLRKLDDRFSVFGHDFSTLLGPGKDTKN